MYFPSSSTPLLAMARPQKFFVPPRNSIVPTQNLVSPPSNLRRNQPENPNADVDVIALSPSEILTTERFTCEKCYKGFARKQNMQIHGRKHGLGWKSQKNQVRKRKVYICPELTCVCHNPARALRGMTAIKRHFLRKHGEKEHKCDKCPKMYAVRLDRDAHSKTCGTKKNSERSSSRNPTMSLTEMTTPPSGGESVAAEEFSQSSPNLGLMAHNDHNIMNFHENNVPSLSTNGANEIGDGDNGNLHGLMNSFGPTIDHNIMNFHENNVPPPFTNGANEFGDGANGNLLGLMNSFGPTIDHNIMNFHENNVPSLSTNRANEIGDGDNGNLHGLMNSFGPTIDHNIMNFHENNVPPPFTNGANEFGDGANGNLLGLMNSFAPTIDHNIMNFHENNVPPPFTNGANEFRDGANGNLLCLMNSFGTTIDHNMMKFHENNVPPLFTNGANEFGDGANGNLLGLMNFFGPTIDHQSRSRNIVDPHFGNNLNIEGPDWKTILDSLDSIEEIMSTVNGQGGHGGHGGSGSSEGQGGYGSLVQGVQCSYGGFGLQGGLGNQDGYGDYGGDPLEGLCDEFWTPQYLEEAEMINMFGF